MGEYLGARLCSTNRPVHGVVNGWIDLSGLSKRLDSSPQRPGVLNGIAYDRQGDRLFFTGKNWPNIFELRIIPHKTKSPKI